MPVVTLFGPNEPVPPEVGILPEYGVGPLALTLNAPSPPIVFFTIVRLPLPVLVIVQTLTSPRARLRAPAAVQSPLITLS